MRGGRARQPLLRDYLALGSHSFARDAHPGMPEGLGAAGEQAGSRARGVVITVSVDSGTATASPRQTFAPSSAMPGGAGPPSRLYTRVLPRFAATPARLDGGGHNVKRLALVEEGREALAGAQLRVCGDEGVVLAQGARASPCSHPSP